MNVINSSHLHLHGCKERKQKRSYIAMATWYLPTWIDHANAVPRSKMLKMRNVNPEQQLWLSPVSCNLPGYQTPRLHMRFGHCTDVINWNS